MSCDICERDACCVSFHSPEEQALFAEVIDLRRQARALQYEICRNIRRATSTETEGEPAPASDTIGD